MFVSRADSGLRMSCARMAMSSDRCSEEEALTFRAYPMPSRITTDERASRGSVFRYRFAPLRNQHEPGLAELRHPRVDETHDGATSFHHLRQGTRGDEPAREGPAAKHAIGFCAVEQAEAIDEPFGEATHPFQLRENRVERPRVGAFVEGAPIFLEIKNRLVGIHRHQ